MRFDLTSVDALLDRASPGRDSFPGSDTGQVALTLKSVRAVSRGPLSDIAALILSKGITRFNAGRQTFLVQLFARWRPFDLLRMEILLTSYSTLHPFMT